MIRGRRQAFALPLPAPVEDEIGRPEEQSHAPPRSVPELAPPANQVGQLLTSAQIEWQLQVGERSVRRYVEQGLLDAVELPGGPRFRQCDVDRFIESRVRKRRGRK